MTAKKKAPAKAKVTDAPTEEPIVSEPYVSPETTLTLEPVDVTYEPAAPVGDGIADDTEALQAAVDNAVVGSIELAAEPDIAAVLPPFPHSLSATHALDSMSPGELAVKTTATGYSWNRNAHFTDGNLIAEGDALAHLPVGATIEKNDGGQIVMTMPATDTRGPFLTYGANVHRCIAQAWPWLVGEGHAKGV